MSDENFQEDHPEIVPKSAPKPEREPIVIEGEATDLTPPEPPSAPLEPETPEDALSEAPTADAASTEPEAVAAAGSEAAEHVSELPPESEPAEFVSEVTPEAEPVPESATMAEPMEAAPPPPPPTSPPTAARSSGFGAAKALGLVVLVAAAALAGAYAGPLLNGDKNAADEHFGAIDAALKDEASARMALEARVAKLEGTAVSAQALASVAADAKAARAAAAKAMTAAPAAAASQAPNPVTANTTAAAPTAPAGTPTPTAVAAAPAPVAAPTPDPEVAKLATGETALADRIEKLESALAAQKSEARAEPVAKVKALDPVAEAVAAISLAQRLSEGEPYAAEFAALSKAGADPSALAALKPYADTGAPTPTKLAVAFNKLAPTFATPAKTEGKGEIVDQMMDKLRGLVKVHPVSEIPGDDPAALASQISAALARGDVEAALATEAKLPEPARTTAAGWAKDAAGLESATAAARTLAEAALKRFADAKS